MPSVLALDAPAYLVDGGEGEPHDAAQRQELPGADAGGGALLPPWLHAEVLRVVHRSAAAVAGRI
jgi:hypothetical protein